MADQVWSDELAEYMRDEIAQTWAHLANALSTNPGALTELTGEEGGSLKHERRIFFAEKGLARMVSVEIHVRDGQGLAIKTIEAKLREKLDLSRKETIAAESNNIALQNIIDALRSELDKKAT